MWSNSVLPSRDRQPYSRAKPYSRAEGAGRPLTRVRGSIGARGPVN